MVLLVFIRDLGSSLMFFGGFLALLYVATNRLSFVVDRARRCSRSARGSSRTTVGHVQDRIDAWLRPVRPALYDDDGGSYQIAQSLFAQADGGLFGNGFGAGAARSCRAADADPARRRRPTSSTR